MEQLSKNSQRPYTDMAEWVLEQYETSAKNILLGTNWGVQTLRETASQLPLAARCQALASQLLRLVANAHRVHAKLVVRTNGEPVPIVPRQLIGDRVESVEASKSQIPLEPYNVEEGFDLMPNVRHANLSYSGLTDLTYFPQWPHLCYLNLEGNRIEQLFDFSEYPELLQINLANNNLRRLPESLIYHANFRELNLIGNPDLAGTDVERLIKGIFLGCATKEGRDTILLLIGSDIISRADIGRIKEETNLFAQHTLFSFSERKTVNGQLYCVLVFHIKEEFRLAPNLR